MWKNLLKNINKKNTQNGKTIKIKYCKVLERIFIMENNDELDKIKLDIKIIQEDLNKSKT